MNRESEECSGDICGELQDWTKNCDGKQVDLAEFVRKMEVLRGGGTVEWKCPFCGGTVRRMEQEDGHTVIGCDSCDMRIRLDIHQET